jgi:phosphatidyl-myo-inositol dimannoside synthase
VTGRALLLSPSRGRGGGIERYVETLEWAFGVQGIEYGRIDLACGGVSAQARMLAEARGLLAQAAGPTRLVLAHRALLPVASLIARGRLVSGISVVCHGSDVWGSRLKPRWFVESRLMCQSAVRVVAVSSYTAGVLANTARGGVLPPGLSREWFDTLVAASESAHPVSGDINVVTAFRLSDWRSKGLPELLAAVTALGRADVHVTVCGSGEPPPELLRLVAQHRQCALLSALDDRELAGQLAAADLFVLATRTRPGSQACGEGFGLVLLEAQVAGTAVVAPAYGGSHDAYLAGFTGMAPTDESAEALSSVLDALLTDSEQLARMGKRASEWAREAFAPEQYAQLAVARLL